MGMEIEIVTIFQYKLIVLTRISLLRSFYYNNMQNYLSQVKLCQQPLQSSKQKIEKDTKDFVKENSIKYGLLLLTVLTNRRLTQAYTKIQSWRHKKASFQLSVQIVNSLSVRAIKRNFFHRIKLPFYQPQNKHYQNANDEQQKQRASFITSFSLYTKPSREESKRIYQIIKSDLNNPLQNIGIESRKRLGLVQQQLVNKMLMAEIKDLKEQIQNLNKRQERQNTKKKESLEMLAEQLQEKNQVIQDLKRSLYLYEQRFSTANNILDSDADSLRKQLQNSERIRQKIENDLDITKSKLQNTNAQLKKATSHIQILQNRLAQTLQMHQQNKIKTQQLTKSQAQLDKLIKSVKQKTKQLNFYFRQFQSDSNHCIQKVQEMENEIKLGILFDYLANFWGMEEPNFTLFTTEEINILVKHRMEWVEAGKQLNDFQDYKPDKDEELSGIIGKGLHENHHHTIFQFLDNSHNEVQTKNKNNAAKAQIQKDRLYGQITQLKSKILHIRDVILNFIKALDIEVGKRSEAQPMLQLIFEIFQYSEEERQGIFAKKKKFFSFM